MYIPQKDTLFFDQKHLDSDLRASINAKLSEDVCYGIFDKEIELVGIDDYIRSDSYFPCVTMKVIFQGADETTSDSLQLQNFSRFTFEMNVYTSGENRRSKNEELTYILVQYLQNSFGLNFNQCEEVTSEVDSVVRWISRATNKIDNVNRKIYKI